MKKRMGGEIGDSPTGGEIGDSPTGKTTGKIGAGDLIEVAWGSCREK